MSVEDRSREEDAGETRNLKINTQPEQTIRQADNIVMGLPRLLRMSPAPRSSTSACPTCYESGWRPLWSARQGNAPHAGGAGNTACRSKGEASPVF